MMSSSKDIDYKERTCSFLAAGGEGAGERKSKTIIWEALIASRCTTLV